ncbi:hypothetical protein AB8Z38_02320 [Bradyrhizobium sp. LLZ17]|uniref:Uncharacterized protein n=1 Tax=Bradyrhizobium sp. LLZ17 TaxID=3239388 RepID=A0AB39XKE1_9BRAD
MPRHNNQLKKFKPGERPVGRAKGTQNKFTRELKEAIITAAELSKHSKKKGLVGYVTYLADDKPGLFASLLSRLIPLQARVNVEGNVEHTIIKAKPETNMSPQELADYYSKLCALPASSKPLVVIDSDTGEPLYSKAAK